MLNAIPCLNSYFILDNIAILCLTVRGSSSPRPQVSSTKSEFVFLKSRPHTTGKNNSLLIIANTFCTHLTCTCTCTCSGSQKRRVKSSKSVVQSEPCIDEAWEASNVAYNSTREHIHRIWSPQERSLSEGQFVRGNRDQPLVIATNDPRSAAGWMSFAGGSSHGRGAGVVDAFTGKNVQIKVR